MKNFRAINARKNAWKYRSDDYIATMRDERCIINERKSERDYFRAGQGQRKKFKPEKASARTQAYYGYYYDTLRID